MSNSKGGKIVKRIVIGVLLIAGIGYGVFYLLPDEQKVKIFQSLGIEDSDFVKNKQLENYVVVRNTNARKALIGDNWVVSGKLFSLHESATVKKVKLMFNFSDGVETRTITKNITPENSLGSKFKEKISGHGDADFVSVEVIDAK